MNIGKRLKEVRGSFSQQQFADVLEVHRNTVARYEREERVPDSEYIEQIYKKFSINPQWILTGEGQMATSKQAEFYIAIDNYFMRKSDKRLYDRIKHHLIEYKKNDPSFSYNMSLDISSLLFSFIDRKANSWLTDENISLTMKSLIDIYKALRTLKKINIEEHKMLDVARMILDPSKYEPTEKEMDLLLDIYKVRENRHKKDK